MPPRRSASAAAASCSRPTTPRRRLFGARWTSGAYDWRRALQANLHFDDTDQEGAGECSCRTRGHGGPLLVWEIGRGGEDVRWQKKFCELGAGRGGRLRLHACEPTDVVKWRDRDRGDALAPLAAARLQPRPDAFATPGFEVALADGRRFACRATDVLDDSAHGCGSRSWARLCARQPEPAAAEEAEEAEAPAAPDAVTYCSLRVRGGLGGRRGRAVAACCRRGRDRRAGRRVRRRRRRAGDIQFRRRRTRAARVVDYALAPRQHSSASWGPMKTPAAARVAAAAADQAQDDADAVVAEVDVDVRRARLLRARRSGGADDALPPTLKIDGDEERARDASSRRPLWWNQHGDAAFSSSVIRGVGPEKGAAPVRVQAGASARQSIVIEVRGADAADPTRGPLFGRRELSLFELAERDAEDELRRLRARLRRAWGAPTPDDEARHQVIPRTIPSSTGA